MPAWVPKAPAGQRKPNEDWSIVCLKRKVGRQNQEVYIYICIYIHVYIYIYMILCRLVDSWLEKQSRKAKSGDVCMYVYIYTYIYI